MNPDHMIEWLLAFALAMVAAAVVVAVVRHFWAAASPVPAHRRLWIAALDHSDTSWRSSASRAQRRLREMPVREQRGQLAVRRC